MRSRLPVAALAVLAALGLGLAGCASDDVGVSTTFDPLTRFPTAATYAWDDTARLLPEDPRVDGPAVDALVKEVANQEFGARGYRAVASGPSDYLLSYQYAVHTWTSPDASKAIGSLSFQLVESASRRRVWSGFGRAELHVGLTPEERRERLHAALARMLEHFPPTQRGDR
jgi:hypothetical protein